MDKLPSCPKCFKYLEYEGQLHECKVPDLSHYHRGPEIINGIEHWDEESLLPERWR
jgi:hypothetical protein